MARGSEEYSDRVVAFEDGEALDDADVYADEDEGAGEAVEGSAADDSCYRADKEASEEFVDGLNERDSVMSWEMSWEMVRVLEGDASFTPSWMKPGVPGLEAVDDLVTVYADKSVGWSAEQREYVAGEVSRLLVEPTSVLSGAWSLGTAGLGRMWRV